MRVGVKIVYSTPQREEEFNTYFKVISAYDVEDAIKKGVKEVEEQGWKIHFKKGKEIQSAQSEML